MKKDIVIAAIAVVVVVALAFGLAALRPRTAATASGSSVTGEKAAAGKTAADEKIVMHVNGEPVTEREFNLFMESAPPESRAFYTSPAGRRALADELVKLKVLEQEGERLGVTNDPDVRLQMEMAQSQIAAGRTLEKLVDQKSEQQIRAEYEKEKGTSVSLRHILIAYAGGAVPAPAGKQAPPADVAMRKAQDIAAKIRAGADFAQMAKAESDDVQSGAQGGMLGPAKPEMLPPEIASVVSKLKPGQMSDPVKTQFGIHIFKVEQPSLEDLRPMLRQKVRQQAAAEEVKRLQDAAKVELDPKFFPPQPNVPPPAAPQAPRSNS